MFMGVPISVVERTQISANAETWLEVRWRCLAAQGRTIGGTGSRRTSPSPAVV